VYEAKEKSKMRAIENRLRAFSIRYDSLSPIQISNDVNKTIFLKSHRQDKKQFFGDLFWSSGIFCATND
jgi:hypothetical protein